MRWGLLCKLKWTLVNQRTLFFIQTDVNHFHWKVCQNYVAEHGGKKRIFADFILNSPFSMEFDFEIDWKNQSLEYNGDQSLLHLNYWILGHNPTSANILVTSDPRFSYSASMSKKHCLKKQDHKTGQCNELLSQKSWHEKGLCCRINWIATAVWRRKRWAVYS